MLTNGVLFQFFSWFLPTDASIQADIPQVATTDRVIQSYYP
jgi:hypothetical protein